MSGDYCELDLDGCQDNPCTEGTNCTDATPGEQVTDGKSYKCSKCPEGTKENEGICLRKYFSAIINQLMKVSEHCGIAASNGN